MVIIIIITPIIQLYNTLYCEKLYFIIMLTDEAITSKKLLTEQPKDLDIAVRYR